MRILSDLYDIYGNILARKNAPITPLAVKKIRDLGEKHKQVRVPLKNTDIFTDFERSFWDERYKTMFEPPISKEDVCDVAGQLMIENDLIFELSNMKNNLPYTYTHVLIVAALVIKLCLTFKNNKYDREIVSHCGFTHDIGKTRIPIAILNKKEKLSQQEMALLQTHPVLGYLLLNYYLKSDRVDCSLASLEHHEKLDGTGYPKGIHKITKYTQLISPVDILDALMTKRPYRENIFSLRSALDYLVLESEKGKLNKEVVLTLISYARKDKPDIKSLKISTKARGPLPEYIANEKYV